MELEKMSIFSQCLQHVSIEEISIIVDIRINTGQTRSKVF